MNLCEDKANSTEIFLCFGKWKVRMRISGPGSVQERRQISRAISEIVTKVFKVLESRSWISHPDAYWRNVERDEDRGVRLGVGPNIRGASGKRGFEIRMERLKLGWSQAVLAERAGIDRSHLSWIETGKAYVTDLTLFKIRRALESGQLNSLQSTPQRSS